MTDSESPQASIVDFPIADAHQHFVDLGLGKNPWLCEPYAIPFRYGDYRAIRRTYLPPDYLRDAGSIPVAKSVYVETEWDPEDPLGEAEWVRGLACEFGYPHAMVAQAWLDRDGIDDLLSAYAGLDLIRGVRHKPAAAHGPYAPAPGPRGAMSDDRWRCGFARLERHGLSFDLQVPHWHLAEAAALARDFPGIRIILDHTGLPGDRSERGLAAWRAGMEAIAACSNVAVKISGLGIPGTPWTVAANGPIVLDTIAMFGVERCMFASNFPVDSLVADFAAIFGGFMRIVEGFDDSEKRKLFHDNTMKIYRIDPGSLKKVHD